MDSQIRQYFLQCFMAPKSEDQIEEEKRAHEKYKEIIQTLPLLPDYKLVMFRNYKCFWFPEPLLAGVMAACDRLRPTAGDVFLVSSPKSGTTLLKALVYAVLNRCSGELGLHPQDCAPFIDQMYAGDRFPDFTVLREPRLLATHIPLSILPVENSGCKIIYLSRDPKDVLASMWRFYLSMEVMHTHGANDQQQNTANSSSDGFNTLFDLFCKGSSPYGPIWEHQMEYWEASKKAPERVLFLKYEELVKDRGSLMAEAERVAEFVGVPFSEEEKRGREVMEGIAELCSLEKMKKFEANNHGERGMEGQWKIRNEAFFGKGKIGGWAEFMSPEMAQKLDDITKTKMHGSGLGYPIA